MASDRANHIAKVGKMVETGRGEPCGKLDLSTHKR